MQLGTYSTPQWNSKPKFLKREHERFCIFLHQIAIMQAYYNIFILCTSKSADSISLELSNTMKLVFLAEGNKGCVSDNCQLTTGKQQRNILEI